VSFTFNWYAQLQLNDPFAVRSHRLGIFEANTYVVQAGGHHDDGDEDLGDDAEKDDSEDAAEDSGDDYELIDGES
jgi:hypothetical protein